jgi:hypothetical protein
MVPGSSCAAVDVPTWGASTRRGATAIRRAGVWLREARGREHETSRRFKRELLFKTNQDRRSIAGPLSHPAGRSRQKPLSHHTQSCSQSYAVLTPASWGDCDADLWLLSVGEPSCHRKAARVVRGHHLHLLSRPNRQPISASTVYVRAAAVQRHRRIVPG